MADLRVGLASCEMSESSSIGTSSDQSPAVQDRVRPTGTWGTEDRSLSEKSTEDHVWRAGMARHSAGGECCLLVATD